MQSHVPSKLFFGSGASYLTGGSGSPEGVVTAPISALYARTNGSTGTTLYVKESGAGNTGWVALSNDAGAAAAAIAAAIGVSVQAYDPQLSSVIGINSKSAAYTLVLTDGGKCIFHPAADTTARIWTIPANASVAFPLGTTVQFDNQFGAGAITIAITSDTLELVGSAGSTGSRTLATGGRAVAEKMTSTLWRISGQELT